MVAKILARFKKPVIIGVALLGFLVVVKWEARADTSRTHLKNRILVQDLGGAEFQTGGILLYVEDLKRGTNKDIGPKDIFEMGSNPYRVTVAQNETQTATNGKSASSPTSKEPESKTDEKKESTSVKKKPLKDFQPSERIEAEQAVDFPYDI